MARRFFGDRNPIGSHFSRMQPSGVATPPIEIIGVSKDTKYRTLREAITPTFVVPFPQGLSRPSSTFEVRTATPQPDLPVAIRRLVRELDPRLQIVWFRTMEQIVNESLAQERFLAQLGAAFGALALLVACIGLYGVLSYAVGRRSRELAIRLSLGAKRKNILSLVLRDDLVLLAIGFLIGLPPAFLVGGLVKGLLFNVESFDPAIAAVAVIAMTATGLLASYLPARRATRVDPAKVLRGE
jgi:ABC-type antimicrobial peptide transport system permease subunit